MDSNDSVIEILDSPTLPTGSKRKHQDGDSDREDNTQSPRHPLLESISSRFQQNQAERQKRNNVLQTKKEMEKVHSNYLKQNSDDPHELARAGLAASLWAKKNGIKDSSLQPARRAVDVASPSCKRKKQASTYLDQRAPKQRATGTSTTTSGRHTVSRLCTSEIQDNISILDDDRSAHILIAPGQDDTGGNYICPVLYCEAKFSSAGALGQHLNLFQHSPHNPCRYIKDCKLFPDPLCYMCPECDVDFSSKELCRNHMNEENHLVFYPPLAISAYLCPQCLYLFKTLGSCWEHMDQSKHHQRSFPFQDDDAGDDLLLPIAAAEEFVEHYIEKCKNTAFKVQCLNCDLKIRKPAALRNHTSETNFQHVICALTFSSQREIFQTYLERFSCDTCHRLYSGQPGTDPRHICAANVIGHIKQDNIRTMAEFVKCCALTRILSLKGEVPRAGLVKDKKVNCFEDHDPTSILDLGINERRARIIPAPQTDTGNSGDNKIKVKQHIKNENVNGRVESGKIKRTSSIVETADTIKNDSVNIVYEKDFSRQNTAGPSTSYDLGQPMDQEESISKPSVSYHSKETPSTSHDLGQPMECIISKPPVLYNVKGIPSSSNDLGGEPIEHSFTNAPVLYNSVEKSSTSYSNMEPATSSASNYTCGLSTMETEDCSKTKIEKVSSEIIILSDSDDSLDVDIETENIGKNHPNNRELTEAELMTMSKAARKRYRKRMRQQKDVTPQGSPKKASQKKVKDSPEDDVGIANHIKDLKRKCHLTEKDLRVATLLSTQNENLTTTENLKHMKNVIFLDYDNYQRFFTELPHCPSQHTFVWAFYGGATVITKRMLSDTYFEMRDKGLVYFSKRCGTTKDATDFAIVLTVGRMDERLPSSVAFTIISADKGFCEVERQMKQSSRRALIVNPRKEKDILLTILKSIVDT